MDRYDVIIIGAGPAGVAAAIQLRRGGVTPLLFEKGRVGGLLWNANLLENYPGFLGGVAGPALAARLGRQLREAGVARRGEEVTAADIDDDALAVTAAGRTYHPRVLVVAAGTEPKRLDGAAPDPRLDGRVLYEVHALRDVVAKKIVVVGGGDAAFDYALNLAGCGNDVVIMNRGAKPKCLPVLWERARAAPGVEYRAPAAVVGLSAGEGGAVVVAYADDAARVYEEADYVVVAIGRTPARRFMTTRLRTAAPRLEEEGRLYFAGDVANGPFRQAAIAAGDGVRAAMEICRRLGSVAR